jgi:hypothetical protein
MLPKVILKVKISNSDKYKKHKIQDEEKKNLWDQIYTKMSEMNIQKTE